MKILKYSPKDQKLKVLIYGPSGAGKTFLAGTAPKPVFASAEDGLLSLRGQDVDYSPINSLKDVKDLLRFLSKEKHEYETVVFDSITEINEIIKRDIEAKNRRSMQLQDWGTLSKEITKIYKAFKSLDMHVIFLAQEKNIFKDEKIEKIVPMLNGQAATEIAYHMDVVAYAYINKSGEHAFTAKPNAGFLTKDRTSLLDESAPLNITEWVKMIGEIEIKKEEKLFDSEEQKNETFAKVNVALSTYHKCSGSNLSEGNFRTKALSFWGVFSVETMTLDQANAALIVLNKKIKASLSELDSKKKEGKKTAVKLKPKPKPKPKLAKEPCISLLKAKAIRELFVDLKVKESMTSMQINKFLMQTLGRIANKHSVERLTENEAKKVSDYLLNYSNNES